MEHFSGSYLHCPLEGDEIRVVWLYPGKGDNQVCCKLIHVPLNDQQGYLALSYVWGDATSTAEILLNEIPYTVTKNLHTALRNMRHPEGMRMLWIDALCINQKDIVERNLQVLRMKDIYENAARVIVWIGDYAPHTQEQVEAAFECTSRLFQKSNENDLSYMCEEIKTTQLQIVRYIAELTHRPWFSRVWVIQESAVCKTPEDYLAYSNQPLLICGQSSIWFSTFNVMATVILQQSAYYDPEYFADGNPREIALIHDFRRIRNKMMEASNSLEELSSITAESQARPHSNSAGPNAAEQLITYLSMVSNGYDATDERDKIYALLGLLTCNKLPSSLAPNYDYPANKIFWEYAIYLLQETKYLDILTGCSYARSGLPSWVPDWNQGLPMSEPCLGKFSHLRFLDDNKKIEVDALLLGVITVVHKPAHLPINLRSIYVNIISEDSAELDSESRRTLRTVVDGIVQTRKALIDIEVDAFGCTALHSGLNPTDIQKWIAGISAGFADPNNNTEHDVENGTGDNMYRMLMDNSRRQDWIDNIEALASFCASIKLRFRYFIYRDESGDYSRPLKIDTEPKPGDILCFLKGASYKFILRPEDNEWRLVGTASGLLPVLNDLSLELSTEEGENKTTKAAEAFWDTNKAKTTRIIIH